MDTIAKITRRGGIAYIAFEGEENETLRIPSSFFLSHPLFAGQTLDKEKYLFLYEHTAHEYALQDALNFLALRERSEKEIRDRLRRTSYPEEIIDKVIQLLLDKSLLSDARFAQEWVHHRSRQYGRARIAQEIRMKGVTDKEAQLALDEMLTPEQEAESASAQAKKACRRLHGDKQKIVQSLMRRGYSYAVARDAAEKALAEE